VDDGSTDGSGRICDEYGEKDGRIRVFHKENGGVSSARNVGLDNACGEWITFVDADDWLESTMLECLLSKTNVQGADVVLCDIVMERVGSSNTFENIKDLHRDLLFGFNTCSAMLIRYGTILCHNIRFVNIRYLEDALFRVVCFCHAQRLKGLAMLYIIMTGGTLLPLCTICLPMPSAI